MRALAVRTSQILLFLVAISGSAGAERPRSPRGVRSTGMTLTLMGAAHLVALLALGGVIASPPGSHNDADIAGVVGMPITAITGVTFLAVGIPLWVNGSRDLRLARELRTPVPRPSSPRGNRATGITLTVMGLINLGLIGAFIPVATADSHGDSAFIGTGVGWGGVGACAGLASVLLSVGIPLWVLGQRDLARQRRLAVGPGGLGATF